jgi:hypothetical protein
LSDDYIVTYSGDKYITYDVIPITEFLWFSLDMAVYIIRIYWFRYSTVGSRFATVRFTTLHFYDLCRVRPAKCVQGLYSFFVWIHKAMYKIKFTFRALRTAICCSWWSHMNCGMYQATPPHNRWMDTGFIRWMQTEKCGIISLLKQHYLGE